MVVSGDEMAAKRVQGKARAKGSLRVVLVDEVPIFSEALGNVISREDDLEYVGSATTVDEAVELVTKHSPDVALIDVDLPSPGVGDFDGIDATRQIKAARPETRVLVLTGQMDLDTMATVAADGACGFLAKTSHLEDICSAIRTAKDGGMFVERELMPVLLDRIRLSARRPVSGGSARATITTREHEVLTLLGEGLDVAVIAKRMGISLNTCRGHVKNVLVKLGSHSQLEAVVEAVHQGLLPSLSR
jgi:DNA-binding NarL/FixJ family response regulator